MTDIVPIANFRTRLEAELAARSLEGAAVPFVINSQEGMAYGPLGDGATILVRAADADLAREVLAGPRTPGVPRAVSVATCPDAAAADRIRSALRAVGINAVSTSEPASSSSHRHRVFVALVHAARARRALRAVMPER